MVPMSPKQLCLAWWMHNAQFLQSNSQEYPKSNIIAIFDYEKTNCRETTIIIQLGNILMLKLSFHIFAL
jgi:hypothetical protein